MYVEIELVEDEPESPDGPLEHARVGDIKGVAALLERLLTQSKRSRKLISNPRHEEAIKPNQSLSR
jgi:hypothetical protein